MIPVMIVGVIYPIILMRDILDNLINSKDIINTT